ncbi:MAG: proline--tRNA ligase [bacterium]|nr:proline--tRNA ligase [bacterium]
MRMSQLFLPTLFEDPKEAELVSHRLMLRAGLIRRLASGIYSYLPLGNMVLQKIIGIVKEEMEHIGYQEVLLPALQPKELWEESGRWEEYGEDMFKLRDRREREFGLGPTHEEVITDLVRREVRSYRDLPLFLYQIQTKFRDEMRPRFGVMRGREFIMKDAYSFDCTSQDADISYQNVYNAYCQIFARCGLRFRAVEADTGLIGGSRSHEFMVLADAGEDIIVSCTACNYAANLQKAEIGEEKDRAEKEKMDDLTLVETPNMKTVEEVAHFLHVTPNKLIKTLFYETEDRLVGCLIRGDQQLNLAKLQRLLGCSILRMADESIIRRVANTIPGFSGPIGLQDVQLIADNSLRNGRNFVVGANKPNMHYMNANIGRDFRVDTFQDIRIATSGDPCPRCEAKLKIGKGIEVGHVFKLDKKYSRSMKATFLDEDGKEKDIIMGCYGIGITRLMASIIEQNSDELGIIWPISVSPYEVLILLVNIQDKIQKEGAFELYEDLKKEKVEVLLDDREESPGKKFKDADLIGIPIRVVIGKRMKEEGVFEVSLRRTRERFLVKKEEAVGKVKELKSLP